MTEPGAPARPAGAGGLRRELKLPRLAPPTLAALAVLALLPAVPLLPALVGGRTLFVRDIGLVWLPQAEAFVRTLAEGAWPLWDRWAGFGRPLLADPRAGVLYPPTWLNLVLPPAAFYSVFAYGHLVLSAWGTFALARHLGLERGGALVAGGVWVASGPLPSLVAMWHHLAGAAWMPWVVLAGERALDAPSARRVLAWGGLLALQLFAGSPDFSLVTGGLILAQLGVRALRARRERGTRASLVVPALAAAAFAAAAGAAQWLPTLDVISRAARLDLGYDTRTVWSLTLARLGEVALPFSWADLPLAPEWQARVLDGRAPWLFSVYLGGAALALAVSGVLAPGAGVAGRWTRALGLSWLVPGLLLALGRHSWVYDLVSGVPPVSLLRYPVKAMLAVAMGWALLAGLGFQAIAAGGRRHRAAAGAVLATLAVVAAGVAVALGTGSLDGYLGARPGLAPEVVSRSLAARLAIAALLASTGAALCGFAARAPHAVAVAVAALSAGELLWHHRNLQPTAPVALFQVRPDTVGALSMPPGGRLYAYDYTQAPTPEAARTGNADAFDLARAPADFARPEAVVLGAYTALTPPSAARWGIEGSFDLDILGFEPRPLDALSRRLRALEADPDAHRRLLALGAVERVAALVPAPWWETLELRTAVPGWFVQPVRLFGVPGALPRAWAVRGVRIADGETALDLVASPSFDPMREAILPAGAPRSPGLSPGRVRVALRRGDRVEIEAQMDRDGLVVMADAWDPGWRATVDGTTVPLLRANVAFRAVAVSSGRHRVVLVYRPRAVIVGSAVSGLALIAAALVALRAARPRRTL